MLTHLQVRNFKSWEDTGPMRLAPLTALFGANSSGKTSLLQALLMLKQTVDSPDRSQALNLGDERSLVELGTFGEALFGHDLGRSMSLELEWTLPAPLSILDPASRATPLAEGGRMAFLNSIAWQSHKDSPARPVVTEMTYRFGGLSVGMRQKAAAPGQYELFPRKGKFRFVRTLGRSWPLPQPTRCYGFPDQARAYHQNAEFLSDLELEFEKCFGSIYYLGPLRDHPRRHYQWAGTQPADMGRRGEKVVDALLASTEAGQKIARGRGLKSWTLEERVAAWLKELGLIESFHVRRVTEDGKLFQVWVRRTPEASEVLLPDVGFGVSQVLPVMTLCYYAPKGSTLILEQPEIHLHPAVQSGLADVLLDAIKTRGIQILLESHSEHLLKRLQRRMAENAASPEEMSLYFCQMEDGRSRLTELELDLFGQVRNWPRDFFGDPLGEIAETQKTILERKIAARRES
jgi:predicted ATPase